MKHMRKLLCLLVATLLLCSCAYQPEQSATSTSTPSPTPAQPAAQAEPDLLSLLLEALEDAETARPLTASFFLWGEAAIAPDFTARVYAALENQSYRDILFYDLFGQSLFVLYDSFTGDIDADNIHSKPTTQTPARLAFTGDINLADTWENMLVLHAQPGGIEDCISADLLARLQNADITLVNNEFCFSDRGAAMAGKQYTFRAATENVGILHTIGVDIVSLANNHVFDYGEDAFYDTLATLQSAGIPYVGGGQDIAEAMLPQYFVVNGVKIAYVAASRAEKYILTPEATETGPGVLRCYDDTLFLQAVEAAAQNADIVVAYPHWGTENTHVLEDVQVELAHKLVDAGADLVIGAHPHVLQGLEWYNGKPIAYSLGNFWFNTDRVDTALLEVEIYGPDDFSVQILPCLQTGGKTSLLEGEEKERILRYLETISDGIQFDENSTLLN